MHTGAGQSRATAEQNDRASTNTMAGPRTRLPVRLSAVILLAPLHCTRTPPFCPKCPRTASTGRAGGRPSASASACASAAAVCWETLPADEREEAKVRLATKTLGPRADTPRSARPPLAILKASETWTQRAFATETLCTCARVHVHVCVRPSQSLVLGSDREVLFIGTF